MDYELKNKVVIVTGATGEIGQSICSAFLKESAIVVPFYRSQNKLNNLLSYCHSKKFTNNICPIRTRLDSETSVNKSVKQVINKFSKIDILVNSIGFVTEGPFLLMDEGQWEKVIDINLTYIVRMIRIVLKHMFTSKSGSIVNISSVLGESFGRGAVAYSVAKAGINRLTESLALEVGKKGIRINAVCPGVIETKMSTAIKFHLSDKILERTALHRFGSPDEVSSAVLFLASDKTASFITGRRLYVDGGLDI